jgi:hypothetical protein
MLRAYIDESGVHDGAKICCVSGYFGGVNQWKKFEREWQPILDRAGVKEFHAKQFWARDRGNRVGAYKSWDDERADKFISELIAVIQGCRIFPMSAAVVTDTWQALNAGEQRYLTGEFFENGKTLIGGAPGKPYFLPFAFCIQIAARHCKSGLKVDYSFDLNHSLRGYSIAYFAMLKKWNVHRGKMGEISFPTSHEALPLQAADLLAFSSYRYSVKTLKLGSNPLRENSVLGRILRRMKDENNDAKLYDHRGLELLLERYRESMSGK